MKKYNRTNFLKSVTGGLLSKGEKSLGDDSERKQSAGLELYEEPWTKVQLAHLLRRSLFGMSLSDMEYFKGKPLDECLDLLLTPSATPSPPLNYYNNEKYTDPLVPLGETWVDAPYGDITVNDFRTENLKTWWAGQMLMQGRNLTEKMTLFLHNHIATEMMTVKDARFSYRYISLLRKYAIGNYKKLVREITSDPNMLVYLNGNTNVKGAPNENYGRELQELFTVGKGPGSHYTEQDVKMAARVLTGWKVAGYQGFHIHSYFYPQDHDTTDKTFSSFYGNTVIKGLPGKDGVKETDQLIDMIFGQHEVAMFLCRKLYRWFVNSLINEQVEASVIVPLAQVAIDHDFEIAPILRALLSSRHFYESSKIGCLIKPPVDFAMGSFRQLGIEIPGVENMQARYDVWYGLWHGATVMYMNLGDPPDVAGWQANYEEPQFDKLWLNSFIFPLRNQITDSMLSDVGLSSNGVLIKADLIKLVSRFSDPQDIDKLLEETSFYFSPIGIGQHQTKYLKDILNGKEGDSWTVLWKKHIDDPKNAEVDETLVARLRFFYKVVLELPEYQLI